jgi:hypothetical protein
MRCFEFSSTERERMIACCLQVTRHDGSFALMAPQEPCLIEAHNSPSCRLPARELHRFR